MQKHVTAVERLLCSYRKHGARTRVWWRQLWDRKPAQVWRQMYSTDHLSPKLGVRLKHAIFMLAVIPFCGCSILDTEVQRGYDSSRNWTEPSVFTMADVRMVTERTHPVLQNQVICTEPSPDVAKALSTAASLTAQGGNGVASGGFGVSGSSAEAVAELAGRSTALLGLRDGLYRACEAYANGIIGADAYGLVLSRYGQLMTTLFLGQDIADAAGAEGKAAAVSAVLQAQGNQPASSNAKGAPTSTTTTTTQSNVGSKTSDAGAQAPGTARAILAVAGGTDIAPKLLVVTGKGGPGDSPAAAPPSASGATPAVSPPANQPAQKTPTSQKTDSSTGTQAQPTSPAGVSTAAALTLGRMNEDYFGLDLDLVHLLVVACIIDGDPTRKHPPPNLAQNNSFLKPLCDQLANIQNIENLEAAVAKSLPVRPINPEVAAAQSANDGPTKKKLGVSP